MMMAVALFMAACSDDDDPTPNPAENITGTYEGYTIADCNYFSNRLTQGEKIAIIAAENGTAVISFESNDWGKFTISDAAVTFNEDKYTVTGSGKTVMGMDAASQKEYDCTVEGTVSKDKKTISFVFNVPSVMGGLKVSFTQGDAPVNLVVADTYKGYTLADCNYFSNRFANEEEFSVSANDDGTVAVVFDSNEWGKFTISGATVELKENVYSIKGSGKTVMGMDAASQKEYDCTVEGTVSKDKETVSFVFNVPSVMGGLKINFIPGDAPATLIIAGVYEGSLAMSVQGAAMGSDDNSKVTIKSQDNGKVEVTLAAFSTEGGMGFQEDIVIADVDVTVNDDVYTLSGTVDTTSGTTKVTGSVEGTIKDGKGELKFVLKPGAMPMYIDCVFTSK